ncbi:phosphate/phosphite/phosphonate ABC transporter substrate-binding protein [Pseudoxanthomonas suwonensis]|uniref:phosphate/phosphite/phosphonate ABC transporter substrate-binding protein n=1 Tax=Pseudoxanthomonas suwonensis TaxID=314722 RepID=UPI00138EDD5A|nr:phosphate/phosphite/phosphonate ABC transporter substrate-binding protein [Pseudoxanthomonas suwonensis]KAF1702468.1 phosphate ABC transporter substrate-binding protein [Pseudoxanthomonas suwonensis]
MTLNLLVAPDFAPDNFPGWYMLGTVLQHRSGTRLHLLMPADAREQAQMLADGLADLVYANPFDATSMIREQGYRAFARPAAHSNEMVIATAAGSPLATVEDLRPGCRIAVTDNRDVRLIGLRLLEPADLTEQDAQWEEVASYQAAARMTLSGQVDAGFFLASAYHALARITRERLKVLVESKLRDISHVLLAHPRVGGDLQPLAQALLAVDPDDAGDAQVLQALGLPRGFEPMELEDAEFMIDLMDTLLD